MVDKKELFQVMNPRKIIFKNTLIRALDKLKSNNVINEYNENNTKNNSSNTNKDILNSK